MQMQMEIEIQMEMQMQIEIVLIVLTVLIVLNHFVLTVLNHDDDHHVYPDNDQDCNIHAHDVFPDDDQDCDIHEKVAPYNLHCHNHDDQIFLCNLDCNNPDDILQVLEIVRPCRIVDESVVLTLKQTDQESTTTF